MKAGHTEVTIAMSIKCEWTEQDIIDDLLGHIKDENTKRQLHNHLTYCAHCQKLHEEWSKILPSVASLPPKPGEHVKKRIYHTIGKKERSFRLNKRLLTACCMAFLLLGVGFVAGRWSMQPDVHQLGHSISNVKTGVIPHQTHAYRVVPVHARNMDGYVWVNASTNDIMLFLDGLKPIQGRDYQAWLISNNNKENAGILQIDQNFAHVIVHHPDIPKVERIVISIEPQGGSAVQTGPNAIDLDLRE